MMSNLPPEPLVINGKTYPLWQQFIDQEAAWVGGTLWDAGEVTKITGIELRANGDNSAWFGVKGEKFDCGFDVEYGGITGGNPGWLTFSGFAGHVWRIKEP